MVLVVSVFNYNNICSWVLLQIVYVPYTDWTYRLFCSVDLRDIFKIVSVRCE